MISVVMPLFNEGPHIYDNLHATAVVLRALGEFEIIVANDGSHDESGAEVDRAAAEIPEVRALHLPHAGKGEALRQGTKLATGDFVIFFDADLDLPPEQLLFFLAVQKARKADAVIGSKLHTDSTVDYPLRRRVYSLGYYVLVKMLFGLPVRDTQTGLKLVRREMLVDALSMTEGRGFALDLELLVRLVQLGATMVEAPVVVQYRMKFGGIGLPAVWSIFRDTLAVWKRTRGNPSA